MINKVHVGKRIAAYRKGKNISQTQLSERLGVTSQAVSKWECGNALPDIELLLELSHLYNVSINQILEDDELLFRLTGRRTDDTGILFSAPDQEYDEEWADGIRSCGWIKRNWEAAQYDFPIKDKIGKNIAELGGVILEIGAGPGGGFMPHILKANRDAVVIVSDLSPAVVRGWKDFLDREIDSPNVYYAVLDFCHMPFRDGSIDIISDGGGIGNCRGNKAQALKEAYRVLKPGGMLVTSTGFVSKETLAEIPTTVQRELLERRPDIFEDLYEDTILAGFCKIDSVVTGGWCTEEDESTIADLASALGVNLKFTSYVRYCTKERNEI